MNEMPSTPQVAARIASELSVSTWQSASAQAILSVADTGILATDNQGIIRAANRAACDIFGYAEQELIGLSVDQLIPPHLRQNHAKLMHRFIKSDESERRMGQRSTVQGYRKDGSLFPMEASIAKSRSGDMADDWMLVVTLRDITERKKAEEDLTRYATHDPLTGLPNRATIHERLTNALQRARRSGLSVVPFCVDLDGFQLINDTHGHEAGDTLLKTVTARLIEQVRPGDTVAHMAGDAFAILCEQVEQPMGLSALAVRINDSLRKPIPFANQQLFVTASIGIAIGTSATHSADDLLRSAGTAMSAVKEKGRDGWQFFNEGLQEQARQRLEITNGLRLAIERKEFSVRFQPIVAAESGRIAGAELLLRWKPPQGEISPALFIPIAETTGSIVPIGTWVFRAACRAEVDWRSRWGERAPYMSVNLSARQLSEPTLAEEFAAILTETGAWPTQMLLEITETSLMADVEANLKVLRQLAELGLRIAVDDFGTGYSSLAQLTRMPVDVLKIDRAFVDGIDKSSESRSIARAIISLGRSLNLKLVAEGVETAAQLRELCGYGCDYIQGYYFYRPLDEASFIDTFQRDQRNDGVPKAEPLYFILYVSRANQALDATARRQLMQEAQTFNRANGISGCLLYRENCFMQLLEGPAELLTALLERIRRDSRHRDLRVVAEGPIQRRAFTDWGMVWRDAEMAEGSPDLTPWQHRYIELIELAEDARLCYTTITAYASANYSVV